MYWIKGILRAPLHVLLTNKEVHVPPPWLVQRGWWREGVLLAVKGRLGYLSCNIGVSCRMLSHIYGNWYFPWFLFKEGSFTQINMASLVFLEVPWASLSMMLKQSGLTGWPVELLCWWMGDEALRCSLILSPKSPSRFSYVFIWTIDVRAFEMVDKSIFL